jgi:hypothetical protein
MLPSHSSSRVASQALRFFTRKDHSMLGFRPLAAIALATLFTGSSLAAEDTHPWLTQPVRIKEPEAYFSNLKDGDRIETPYVLKFGLTRYGLAAITKEVARAGHQHLLVNRDLPLDFTKPLPFNDQYIHFGKGQMETVLAFPPGEYSLRLLLADHKHIPFFIYSKPVNITVTRKNSIDPKSLVVPGVAILSPRSGETLLPGFRLQLHASGLNVSHAAIQDEGVGHFRIVLERPGAAPERISLRSGVTEVWLAPPAGSYKLSAELVSNGASGKLVAVSAPVQITVAKR